jgi:hypothetical protein
VGEWSERGIAALCGNGADPEILAAANLGAARCLLVAIPDAFEGGRVVEQARAINPKLPIIARAHFEEEIAHLKDYGANVVVMGEHEIARLWSTMWRRPRRRACGRRCRTAFACVRGGRCSARSGRLHATTAAHHHDRRVTLAWAFAGLAHRLKLPPLVGYLVACIVIGPFRRL